MLSIPEKRYESTLISYLTDPEIDALLAAPDRSTWTGRRDHALLLVAAQTGLRASELASLRCEDSTSTPAGSDAKAKAERKGARHSAASPGRSCASGYANSSGDPAGPLFPSRNSGHLTRSAIWRLVVKHTATARERCQSLTAKNITPHTLRHTAAMRLLRAEPPVDPATIALWLGHETLDSTNKYVHADMELKRRALDRTTPTNTKPGRYRAPDRLLAFLESL